MDDQKGDNGVAAELQNGREWAGERLAAIDKQARRFLTEHPIAALACAVGLGFLAARLFGGRRPR